MTTPREWPHSGPKNYSIVEKLFESCATHSGGRMCAEREIRRGDWCERCLAGQAILDTLDRGFQPIEAGVSEDLRKFYPAEKLLDRLRHSYTASPIPPCRICGGKLEVQSIGGGQSTKWACPKPADVTYGDWSDHYAGSSFIQNRDGDSDVLALVELIETLVGRPVSEQQ